MKPLTVVNRLAPAFALAALVLALAGCRDNTPQPAPSPTAPPVAVSTAEPASAEATARVEPDQGGTIALDTGADITFPPQSVSGSTVVTFRTDQEASPAPIPRSPIGPAYAVEVREGEITGIALVRLPLPPGVSPDTYELAPYKWNGSTWERVTGRLQDGYLQFGVSEPGLFRIQGQWRFANAALGLVKADAIGGQLSVPLTVVGQYRFSALPAMDGEFVNARLLLKQDTSGGAGQALGVEELDATVEEAPLLFKPDPANPRGVIEFNQIFEVEPDLLDIVPGGSTRFYAVLEVQDSAAPTRRSSTAVEYTQTLPLQIVGGEVVRPKLADETRYSLRWNVTLDDAPFYQEQAATDRLEVQPLIDRGGLGSYHVVLEMEQEGAWVPVSNPVTFELALRASPTPLPGTEEPGEIASNLSTPTPTRGAPAEIPVPPTRRPTPAVPEPNGGLATPTPTIVGAPSLTPAAAQTRINGTSAFYADKASLAAGECATLTWQVDNILAVYLDGSPVTGRESRQVCPVRTTTYTLRTQSASGFQDRTVTISVTGANTTPQAGDIEFGADVYQVPLGGCATLRWRAVNVRAVYLNDAGVAGEASQQVCPTATTNYVLRVESTTGQTNTRSVTIVVNQTGTASTQRFWAEQYALPGGGCTTLHWKVLNVRQVFIDEQGVPGEGTSQVCPAGTQFYSMRVVDNNGQETFREITLTADDPGLAPNEVILHGAVSNVTNPTDIDPDLPGDQRGYVLTIGGINPIFAGSNGFSQSSVTLRVPQEAADSGPNGPVDWPLRTGQLIEARATCTDNICSIDLQTPAYLFLRSE